MRERKTEKSMWTIVKRSTRKEMKKRIIINRKAKTSVCYYQDCESTA